MSAPWKETEKEDTSPEAFDVVSLIKKLQLQVEYLEKKIDTLIAQSQGGGARSSEGRPAFRDRERSSYSKPFRSYGGGSSGGYEKREYRGNRDQGERSEYRPREGRSSRDDSRGGGYSGGGAPFKKFGGGGYKGKPSYASKGKPSFSSRQER